MVVWDWNLHRFSDGAYLGRLENAKDRTLSPARNSPGAASFRLPLDDDMAYLVDNLSTYIVCQRNGVTKWEGKVWDTTEDASQGYMNVNCMGWAEELNHRFTADEISFASMSIGRIAWALVAHADLIDGTMGFTVGPAQDAGFTLDNYKLGKDLNILSEIQKLTEVENGIDFYFDYTDRMFKFVNRKGVDRPDVHFGYRAGPRNLTNAIRSRQGSRTVNRMKAINPSTGNFVIEDNPSSIAARGVYREIQTLNGLRATTPEQEAQGLRSYAAAEVIVRGGPVTTYDATVLAQGNNVEVPKPYDHFEEGDTMRLSVERGRFTLDRETIRCYGFSMSIGDNNDEKLNSLTLTP